MPRHTTESGFGQLNLDAYASLAAAVSAIGTNSKELVISKSITVSGNLTVPSNILLKIQPGAQITIDLAVNLIIEQEVCAAREKIFYSTGDAKLIGNIYPEWFGAKGDGVTNDTNSINKAITSAYGGGGASIVFAGRTYVAQDVILKSNVNIILDPNTIICAVDRNTGNIFTLDEIDNVIIFGNNGTIEGLGYPNDRINVKITGCSNIRIYNLYSINGFDGFLIGSAEDANPVYSDNITIRDCVARDNYRNNISIISCKNSLISGCRFDGAVSNAPGAGIDVEPDSPYHLIQDVVVENCICSDNYGFGILVNTYSDTVLNFFDITFSSCTVCDMVEDACAGYDIQGFAEGCKGGRILFRDCDAYGIAGYGLWISNKSPDGPLVQIERMKLVRVATGNPAQFRLNLDDASVIMYNNTTAAYTPSGGVLINGLDIRDEIRDRTPMYIYSGGGITDEWTDVIINDYHLINTKGYVNQMPYASHGASVFIDYRDGLYMDRTTDLLLTTRFHNVVWHNTSATGEINFTLPEIQYVGAAIKFVFQVRNNEYMRITANANDTIFPDIDGYGDELHMRSNTIGSCLELKKMNNDGWIISNINGVWEYDHVPP